MKSKSNLKDYKNAYFKKLSIIFFALFITYALLSIGSKDYLRTLTSLIATVLIPIFMGVLLWHLSIFIFRKKQLNETNSFSSRHSC